MSDIDRDTGRPRHVGRTAQVVIRLTERVQTGTTTRRDGRHHASVVMRPRLTVAYAAPRAPIAPLCIPVARIGDE